MSVLPDLNALRSHDDTAWDLAHRWLFPMACATAASKLHGSLAEQVEDTAAEALADLWGKIHTVDSVESLPRLIVAITHCRVMDLIRRHTSQKRGSGKVESMDAGQEDGGSQFEPSDPTDPLASLGYQELAELLGKAMDNLTPRLKALLFDSLLKGVKTPELASKYGLSEGSIHKTVGRGIDQLVEELGKVPRLKQELREVLQIAVRNLSLWLCLA